MCASIRNDLVSRAASGSGQQQSSSFHKFSEIPLCAGWTGPCEVRILSIGHAFDEPLWARVEENIRRTARRSS